MLPFVNKQPVAVAAAVRAVLYALVLLNVISLTEEQLAGIAIALELVLGLFVWNASTPVASPTLPTGTTVKVQGTEDEVLVQPSPPGPVGVDTSAGVTYSVSGAAPTAGAGTGYDANVVSRGSSEDAP